MAVNAGGPNNMAPPVDMASIKEETNALFKKEGNGDEHEVSQSSYVNIRPFKQTVIRFSANLF